MKIILLIIGLMALVALIVVAYKWHKADKLASEIRQKHFEFLLKAMQ